MNRKRMFLRLVMKDALVRKDRALTALLSVAVVATMATVALTIYYDLETRLSREFRGFGANVIVTKHEGSLSADDLSKINSVAGRTGDVVPIAYAIGTTSDGKKIVVGGADVDRLTKLNSWWSLSVRDEGPALIGARANDEVPVGPLKLSFARGSDVISPGRVFRSGSEDDSRIYIPLSGFTALTGVAPNTALVRIDGRPSGIQQAINQLRSSLPLLEVEPVRQITQAQTAVLGKTRSVVLAASAVVVILIMVCMVATFSSSVLERRRDYAVMKALGASNRAVNVLFASQSVFLALAGALIGFAAGSGVAYWIGKANFDAAILPQAVLLLPVTLGSILLALIASTAPIRLLQRIQPAGILRGE
jgi:putative ABC transport system permease protein